MEALSPNLPPSFSIKIQGEAEFLRAYAYFYLVNLYGKVHLITSTDVNTNRSAHQSDSATVYKQILDDLNDAKIDLAFFDHPQLNRLINTHNTRHHFFVTTPWRRLYSLIIAKEVEESMRGLGRLLQGEQAPLHSRHGQEAGFH